MRAAIIFPPQWDPRHPPLAPAILAASFNNAGIEVRHFDLNLALYRQLLKPSIEGDIEDYLQKKLLDPENLRNARAYLQTSEQLQKIFDEKFDPQGSSRLFWDACQGFPAIASSKDWQRIIVNEKPMPAIRHLQKAYFRAAGLGTGFGLFFSYFRYSACCHPESGCNYPSPTA
jgi:hypothetical protein